MSSKKIVSDEKAAEWRRLYESGESLQGIAYIECAKGRPCSDWFVKRVLLGLGVVMRSKRQASVVAATRRQSSHEAHIAARRAGRA